MTIHHGAMIGVAVVILGALCGTPQGRLTRKPPHATQGRLSGRPFFSMKL